MSNSNSNGNDDRKQDDARANNRSNQHGSRVVVFDEDNLRQNKEWHDANPVTKHIDEPKTPYCTDEGNYEDEEDIKQLNEDHHDRGDLEILTSANTEHNKGVGSGYRPSAADGTAQPACNNNSNNHHHHHQHDYSKSIEENKHMVRSTTDDVVGTNDDDNGNNNNNNGKKPDSNWTNAEYNRIGSEALRTQPVIFTSVAPKIQEDEGDNNSTTTTTTTIMPTNKNSNEDTAAVSSDPFSVSTTSNPSQSKRTPVGLKLGAFDEEEQEKAEKVRHEAEFNTMRKAVYRDEGMKFKEMMKAAQQKAMEEEEEEEVDQD